MGIWGKKRIHERIMSFSLAMSTCVALLFGANSNVSVAKAANNISNPRVSEDGTVTWDVVQFGNYYINNENEKEPIEWRVLSVDGDVALLLADKAIEYLPYGDNEEDIEWETSTLRKWLNNSESGFIKEAFTPKEQNDIKNIVFDGNDVSIDNQKSSEDKVFIPSRAEMLNTAYGFEGCKYSKARQTKPTDYVKNKMVQGSVNEEGFCGWWLRTEPGFTMFDLVADDGGWCNGVRGIVDLAKAVRPAMYVNVNSDYIKFTTETTSEVNLNDELYQLDGRRNYKVTYYSDEGYLRYYSERKVSEDSEMEIYEDGGLECDKTVIANRAAGKIVSYDAWGGDYEGHSLLGWTTEGDDTVYVMYGYGLGEGQKYLHEYVVKKDVTFKAVWIDNSVQEANDDPVPTTPEEDKKAEDPVEPVPISPGGTGVSGTSTGEANGIVTDQTDTSCKQSEGTSGSTDGEKQTAIGDMSGSSGETPSKTSLSREITFHSDKGYISGQADNTEVKYTTSRGSKISTISEIRVPGISAYYPDYISMPDGKYEGYVFKGWKTEDNDNVYDFSIKACSTLVEFPNESDTSLDIVTDYVVTDDVTFEAVWEWEEQYQVTFELDRDDLWYDASIRCNKNELLNNYAVPIMYDDRVFKGWKIAGDRTLYVTDKDNVAENKKYIGDYVVTGPVTFEVVWEDDLNVNAGDYIPSNISMDANLNITYDGVLDGDRYYYGTVEIKNEEGNYDFVYSFGGRGWIPFNWYNQMPNAFTESGDYRIRISVIDQNENEEYSDYYEFSWKKPKQSLSIPQNVRWSESKYGVATCDKVENAYAYYYEFFMDGESIGGGWTYDADIPDYDNSSSIEEYGREHKYTFRVMALVEEPDKYAHSIWSDESFVLGTDTSGELTPQNTKEDASKHNNEDAGDSEGKDNTGKNNDNGNKTDIIPTTTDVPATSETPKTTEDSTTTTEQIVTTPKKAKILFAKNSKKKTMVIKWKKVDNVKGYEVSYALNKKFTKSNIIKTSSKSSFTANKLKKDKTYYVRVRAYNIDSDGLKIYGKWSAVKKVKIKK